MVLAQGTLRLWPIILVAAAAMLWLRPLGRLVFFAIGTLFLLLASTPIVPPGLHGEGFALSFIGLAICAATMLSEAVMRLIRVIGLDWVK